MEAVQFHPTPIVPSGILLTEGCRGDGGILRDVDGYRFMPDYEPEKKELASRDVVSRRMMEHIRKGKGVKSPYGDHLWLDISILGRAHVEKIFAMCKIFVKLLMVLIQQMKVQKVGRQFFQCSIILWVELELNQRVKVNG